MRMACDTSTPTMRETPGSFIVTPINCSAISIAMRLCEMKRNCVAADISRTRRQKRSVFGSSSGASTLIEQAERCRIQLEQREHERRRGQRLFAAGQQMDRRIAFAGRLRDDLDTGVEDFLTSQHQFGVTTAEQRREQAAELLVDLVVGVPQLRAQVSRSMRRIASSSVCTASARSPACASR